MAAPVGGGRAGTFVRLRSPADDERTVTEIGGARRPDRVTAPPPSPFRVIKPVRACFVGRSEVRGGVTDAFVYGRAGVTGTDTAVSAPLRRAPNGIARRDEFPTRRPLLDTPRPRVGDTPKTSLAATIFVRFTSPPCAVKYRGIGITTGTESRRVT